MVSNYNILELTCNIQICTSNLGQKLINAKSGSLIIFNLGLMAGRLIPHRYRPVFCLSTLPIKNLLTSQLVKIEYRTILPFPISNQTMCSRIVFGKAVSIITTRISEKSSEKITDASSFSRSRLLGNHSAYHLDLKHNFVFRSFSQNSVLYALFRKIVWITMFQS